MLFCRLVVMATWCCGCGNMMSTSLVSHSTHGPSRYGICGYVECPWGWSADREVSPTWPAMLLGGHVAGHRTDQPTLQASTLNIWHGMATNCHTRLLIYQPFRLTPIHELRPTNCKQRWHRAKSIYQPRSRPISLQQGSPICKNSLVHF